MPPLTGLEVRGLLNCRGKVAMVHFAHEHCVHFEINFVTEANVMGVAFYPRIENTNAEWALDISGKALAKSSDKLFKLIKKQGHKELMHYFVPSEEDLDELVADKKSQAVWFNPTEGLALIDAMTRAFQEHRSQFENPEHLQEDLECFRKILERTASEGLRWNLGMDC